MIFHFKMADGGPWNTYQRVLEFLTNKRKIKRYPVSNLLEFIFIYF